MRTTIARIGCDKTKGYPKYINTKGDFENLLKMPEFRERAKQDLQKIYEMKDDKATKIIVKDIFTTKKSYKEHFKQGTITTEVHNIFNNHNQVISQNAIIVNIIEDTSGKKTWFLENENQTYIIKETNNNLEVGMEQPEEIDNPMPVYKRYGFESRKEVKELIDKKSIKEVKGV